MENRQYWIVTWREPHQWDRLCAILDATAEEADQWVKTNRPNATDVCKYIALTEKEYNEMEERKNGLDA